MIELKWHNVEPYNRVREMLQKEDRVAYISCTGTGKTFVAAKYVEENGLEDKTLVICPTNVIREEWKEVLPNVKVVTYAALKNIDSAAKYQLIITDELHHLMADEWHKSFDRIMEGYKGKVLGLTATNIRYLDGCKDVAKEYFNDCKVYGYDLAEAIEGGILPTFTYVSALYNFTEYKKDVLKKYNVSEKLRARLDLCENQYAVEGIIKKHIVGKKILVFADGIDVMEDVVSMIRKTYPDDDVLKVSVKEKDSHNKNAIKQFEKAVEKTFLVSVDMLNEGIHIEGVDTVIMLRRTKSAIVYLQQLGRALATNNRHKKPVIIDLVANHHNLITYTKLQNSSIDRLFNNIKKKKKEIIVADYAMSELELIDHIRDVYGVNRKEWTMEEDKILVENARMKVPELQRNFFPYRTLSSVLQRKAKVCGCVFTEKFTEEEYRIAEANWDKTPTELSKLLPYMKELRIKYLLQIARKRLGKIKRVEKVVWTKEEEKTMIDNLGKGFEYVAKLFPDKKRVKVWQKWYYLSVQKGIIKPGKKSMPLEEWEIQYIKDNSKMSVKELKKTLKNRTEASIRNTRHKYGVSKQIKMWTKDEEEYLRENLNKTNDEIAKVLPHTKKSIQYKRRRLEKRIG